jgi:hypothetical protein
MQVAAHVFCSLPISLCHSSYLFAGCEKLGREFRALHEVAFQVTNGCIVVKEKERPCQVASHKANNFISRPSHAAQTRECLFTANSFFFPR